MTAEFHGWCFVSASFTHTLAPIAVLWQKVEVQEICELHQNNDLQYTGDNECPYRHVAILESDSTHHSQEMYKHELTNLISAVSCSL